MHVMIVVCVSMLYYLPSEFLLVLHAQGEFPPPPDNGLASGALLFPLCSQYWRDGLLSVCCSNIDPNISPPLHPLIGHVSRKAVGAAYQGLLAHGISKWIGWVVDSERRKMLYQNNGQINAVICNHICLSDYTTKIISIHSWEYYVGRCKFLQLTGPEWMSFAVGTSASATFFALPADCWIHY